MKNKKLVIYLPLVITIFIILPGTHDTLSLPKLMGFTLATLLLIFLKPIKFKYKDISLLPLAGIGLVYTISQFFKPIPIEVFLLGQFGRNFGLFFFLSITIYYIYVLSSDFNKSLDSFERIFRPVLIISAVYGFVQILKLDPIKWSKYPGDVVLTLSNPNIASAFFGIAAAYLYFDLKNRITKYIASSIFLVLVYFTHSIQGFYIFIVTMGVLELFFNKKIKLRSRKILYLIPILTIIGYLVIDKLWKFVYENGSVQPRINYWLNAFKIFKDHPIFGVGIDNLSQYSPQYKDLVLLKQDGMFQYMDRAHNVFLDYFVTGGFLSGLLWILFVFITSFRAYKLFRNGGQKHLALISIWFGYLAQALISTDHIALVILGFISAALINSGYIHISQSDENQPVLKNSQIQRTITLSTLIVLIFIFYNFAQTERQSYLILNDSYSGNSINYYLNNDWIVPRTAEELAVKLAKGSDSETRGLIADKLLSVNNMSHQGWYFKAVAMEGQKDYVNALKYMNKAINLDPTNSVYLLSKSVIYIEKNDLISAKVYYLKTLRANPNQMGIDYVRAKLKDYL